MQHNYYIYCIINIPSNHYIQSNYHIIYNFNFSSSLSKKNKNFTFIKRNMAEILDVEETTSYNKNILNEKLDND